MRRLVTITLFLFAVLVGTVLAYPPAILTSTPTTITVDGLDCATNYEIRVREWRSGAWRDQLTYQKMTAACPTPTPTPTPSPTPTPTPSPTPSPTPTPMPQPSGCASSTLNTPDGPDPWGGCWPGPTTTGAPAGTTFTTPPVNSDGDLVITTNNTVVDGISLMGVQGEGGILVEATGVTIKNSKVRFIDTDFAAPNADGGAHPTVIQDTTIDCQQLPLPGSGIATAFYYGNYTLTRVNVHGCENGLDMSSGHVTVTDSYWHDLAQCPTSSCSPVDLHSGVVQGNPGANNTFQHNWMQALNPADCFPATNYDDGHCNGSGVIGYNNQSSGSNNVLIKRNALYGGGASIRCPQLPDTNFVLTENLMWPEFNPVGVSDDCAPFDAGTNRSGSTGAVLTLP